MSVKKFVKHYELVRKHNINKLGSLDKTFSNFVVQFTLIRHFARRFKVEENDIQKRLMNIEMSMQFHDFMHQQFDHLTMIIEKVVGMMKSGEIDLNNKENAEFLKKVNMFVDELGKLIITTYGDSYNTLKTEFISIWSNDEENPDLEKVMALLNLDKNETMEFRHLIIHQNEDLIDTTGVDQGQEVYNFIEPMLSMQSERDLLAQVTGVEIEEEEDEFDLF